MGIFKLIRAFQKANGRSPTPSELNKLKQQADIMSKQENVIPFPQGGKDRVPVNEQFKSAGVKDAVESMFGPLGKKPESGIESLDEFKALENAYEDELIKKEIKGARPGNINYEEMQKKFSDVKLYGDESFDELLQIEKTGKHPRDKADGGRAGYAVGGLSKLLKMLQGKVGKKNITTADKIARPESALNREMFEDFNQRNMKPSYADKDKRIIPEGTTEEDIDLAILKGNFLRKYEGKIDPQLAKAIENDTNAQRVKEVIAEVEQASIMQQKGMGAEEIVNTLLDASKRTKQASGGLAYMLGEEPRSEYSGGGGAGAPPVTYDDNIDNIGPGPTMPPNTMMNTPSIDPKMLNQGLGSGININPRALQNGTLQIPTQGLANGGRIGFKEGGPPNPGRRNFMKLMAGLASLPIVGKLFKGAKVASKVVPLKGTTTTMPAWFPKFVDKVIEKGVGTKIDADIMKYEVKELPGIQVTKHDDGRIYVEGQNDYSRSYDIEYQPPGYEVTDYKTGKAVKTKGDFTASEEVPVNMDMDGNVDFEGEILEEVGDILTSDGRVMEEFATGTKLKTSTRGEHRVGQAEVAAENAADEAAERAAMEADDFASGGLAKLLGE